MGFNQNIQKNIMIQGADYNYLYKYNISNQVEYIMIAFPWNENEKRKTKQSDAVWQITKYIYDGVYVIEVIYADGDSSFSHQASKYLDYNYVIEN